MINRRTLAIALGGFAIGSLPFLIYNGHRRAETFRSSAHLDPRSAPPKFIHVRGALNGSGLFGYIVSEEWTDQPKNPASGVGRAAVYLRDRFGAHQKDGMEYAMLLALVAVPLWWPSRAARFSLVFMAAAWLLMASTKDAGASVHHTVLLWPFPQLFVAIVIAAIPLGWVGRWAIAAVVAVLVALNLLVVNQYLAQFARNGAEGVYSDAMYSLSQTLEDDSARRAYILDWGIQFPLDLLHNGRLQMRNGQEPFLSETQSDYAKGLAQRMLADRGALFVDHVQKREVFDEIRKRFDRAVEAEGCVETDRRVVEDSNGRPVFEIFGLNCFATDRHR